MHGFTAINQLKADYAIKPSMVLNVKALSGVCCALKPHSPCALRLPIAFRYNSLLLGFEMSLLRTTFLDTISLVEAIHLRLVHTIARTLVAVIVSVYNI